jgi:hypothetical protein
MVPCLGALNFEYRLALREEDFNGIKNIEIEKRYE